MYAASKTPFLTSKTQPSLGSEEAMLSYKILTLLCRSDLGFKNIFRDAGLKIVQEKIQHGLPEGLYPVKM
jgi:protein N-terminal methyltransferase